MKTTLKYYLILLSIPLIAIAFMAQSGGATSGGATGSPGDVASAPSGASGDCLMCHANSGNYNTGLEIIITPTPTNGYALGQTYAITVNQTSTGASEHGFQITAENSVASKAGTFAVTDAVHTQVQSFNHYVTHTKAGDDEISWSFNWTAPLTDNGIITFYAATIAGNPNGTGTTTTNSQMATATYLIGGVLGINQSKLLGFSMFPNPSNGQVTLQLPTDTNQAKVSVFDYLGKLLMQKSVSSLNNTIDVSNLNSGIYFVRIETDTKVGTKKLILR